MQCSSRQADGSCFCKRHSLLGGGNGNLGKFSDPRPDIIKYPKHPDDEWLWADDPRCEEFRRSNDDKQQKKSKAAAKPKAKQSAIVYGDVSWTTVAQDTKMKKELALCYLQHHNIAITDPLGKTFGVGTLRGLVRNHFYDRNQDDQATQESSPRPPSENDSDETLQNDESQDIHHNEAPNDISQNDPEDIAEQPLNEAPTDDEADPDFSDITYQGVPYKLDSFNDVYNCGDLAHMGSWNDEKKRIIFENNEAKLLHLENTENID